MKTNTEKPEYDMLVYDVLVYPDEMVNKQAAVAFMPKIKSTIMNYPQRMTIREIAATCGRNRHPFAPIIAQGKGTLCAKNWVSQQIYALDFDNDDLNDEGKKCVAHKPYYLSPSEAVRRSKSMGHTPAFGYMTLSSRSNHERFRLVYVLDEPCTTKEEHDAVYAALAADFIIEDRCLIDTSCREQSRVFFGGTGTFSLSYRSVLSKKELVEKGKQVLLDGLDKKATPTKPALQANKLDKLIEALKHDTELIAKNRKTPYESLETPVFMRAERLSTNTPHKKEEYNNNIISSIYKNTLPSCGGQWSDPASPVMTRAPEDFVEFCLQNVPFEALFEVKVEQKFRCALPEHEDVHPSASIFIGDDGVHRYKCHGCGRHFNIFSFIREVTGCSYVTAYRLVSIIFGVPFETEWQAGCRDQISHYIILLGSEHFDKKYSILKKYLLRRRAMTDFVLLLNIMNSMVMDYKAVNSQKPMFCISLVRLQKEYGNFGRKLSLDSLYEKIKMFAHLGLIEIIPDEQMPSRTLKVLRKCQRNNEREYRTSCYHIPLGSQQTLEHATEVILADKGGSVRAATISSREGLTRTSGDIEAKKVFAQRQSEWQKKENEKLSAEVEKFYKSYVSATRNLIKKKGWTTEREIIDRMHCLDKKKRSQYSLICLPQLLREEQLQRVSFTKMIQNKYGIDKKQAKLCYGSSKVIVPEPKEV